MLIVCEGEKTEVGYFEEIRQIARLPMLHLRVIHSPNGTEPLQIINGAEEAFLKTRGFERIYVVFDRDEHLTYANAISKAEAMDKRFRNDERQPVDFQAVASVPCFELWLLLHFVDVFELIHRTEAFDRLRAHLAGYDKGKSGTFAATMHKLEDASRRAAILKRRHNRLPGTELYTEVHELVDALLRMKGSEN